jgi:hypothetical protein
MLLLIMQAISGMRSMGSPDDIMRIADQFAQQGDHANAAAIYEMVGRETLGYYLSYHDEDGALDTVVQDCIKGLGNCLAGEQEDEGRFLRPSLPFIGSMLTRVAMASSMTFHLSWCNTRPLGKSAPLHRGFELPSQKPRVRTGVLSDMEEVSWVFKFHPGQRLRALFGWSAYLQGQRI